MRLALGAAMPLALLLASAAGAQAPSTGQTVIYGGAGRNLEDEAGIGATPLALGVLRQSDASRLVFGFDLAGEGTMLDSTYGDDEFRQALSFNVLVGAKLSGNAGTRLDAGLLLGMRQTTADCPDSYLGFQCYADQPPEVEYEVNYGAMVGVSTGRVMFGLRATGESVQGLVGLRF